MSSGIGWFLLKREGKFLYFSFHPCTCQAVWLECWLAFFPYMFWLFCLHQWPAVHRCSLFMGMFLFWVFPKVAVLWQGAEIYKRGRARRFIQSVVESQRVKSYWTSKAASIPPAYSLRRDRAYDELQIFCNRSRAIQTDLYNSRCLSEPR